MIESISKYKNWLVGMLLLILSAYYVNSTMFSHSHIISGQQIYHSHFFSGSHTTSEDGGHTQDAADLIAALGNIIIEQQTFISHVDSPEQQLEFEALVRTTAQATFFLECCAGLRAPPIA